MRLLNSIITMHRDKLNSVSHTILKLLLDSLLLFFPTNACAEPWYQVETIVFEHLYLSNNNEVWDKIPGLPNKDRLVTINTDPADKNNTAYRAIPGDSWRFGAILSKLKYSKKYRPILHMAWQQPGVNASRARNVQIRKKEETSRKDDLEMPLIKIDGVIKIRSSRLLHVDVDLVYFFQAVPENSLLYGSQSGNLGNLYRYTRLKESRRIRLDEIHYFDHPLFGALIQVRRMSNQ